MIFRTTAESIIPVNIMALLNSFHLKETRCIPW